MISFVLGVGFLVGNFILGYVIFFVGFMYLMVILCGICFFLVLGMCFVLEILFFERCLIVRFYCINNFKDIF